jgi:hypothetical protein
MSCSPMVEIASLLTASAYKNGCHDDVAPWPTVSDSSSASAATSASPAPVAAPRLRPGSPARPAAPRRAAAPPRSARPPPPRTTAGPARAWSPAAPQAVRCGGRLLGGHRHAASSVCSVIFDAARSPASFATAAAVNTATATPTGLAPPGAAASTIIGFYVEHRTAVLLGEYIGGVLLLWFLWSIRSFLMRAEGTPGVSARSGRTVPSRGAGRGARPCGSG